MTNRILSGGHRPAVAIFALLTALMFALPGCALNTTRVNNDELAVIQTQLAQQQMELAQHQQALVAIHGAQMHHHATTVSAQTETLKSLTTLLQRDTRVRQCPPPPAPAECPPRSSASSAQSANGTDKILVGELEYVRLHPPGNVYEARIDTGATTSSLNAISIQEFERDGDDWVRFEIPHEDGDNVEVEKPVARFVRIVQSAAESGDRRPVVELQLELGTVTRMAEFTLTDRRHLNHPVLIGRNVLRDLIIVDVSAKHATQLSEDALEDDEDDE